MRKRTRRRPGQALVEFTLAATLIFFLLSAAVDLGLMFFSLQAMRVAAQEGATFGSHPIVKYDAAGNMLGVDLDYAKIIERVRESAGTPSVGMVNMLDLNNDEVDDKTQGSIVPLKPSSYAEASNPAHFISIELLRGPNASELTSGSTCSASQMNNNARNCWVRVWVSYNYRLFFPFAPTFTNTFKLRTQFTIQVRGLNPMAP